MTDAPLGVVIVGNGVAGVMTARLVAERNPAMQVTIYSDEPYLYYPRPRLIELLAGQAEPKDMAFYPADWYAKRGIQVELGRRVAVLRPDQHAIVLADGQVVPYSRLVLANGASSWRPPVPGMELDGVHTLRSMDDALALCHRAAQSQHAVVLGGGLLGLDTAMGLRAHGLRVSVVELLPRLLPRQLDAEGAQVLQRLIEARGVQIITGEVCVRIEDSARVKRVHLKNGQALETDFVVVSAGVRPNLALAQGAGLACNRGVLVNERLQTSLPDIYAVGDVAEFSQRVWGIIPAALAQARVAAAQIAGDRNVLYQDIVPSTTLKVTGIDVASIGEVNPEGSDYQEVRATDPTAGTYRKLVLRGGHVVGAIVIGERASVRPITQLIENRVDVSSHATALLDPGLDPKSLL